MFKFASVAAWSIAVVTEKIQKTQCLLDCAARSERDDGRRADKTPSAGG